MLPLFYEIGRAAGFSAADAYANWRETVDLMSNEVMCDAYHVVVVEDGDEPIYQGAPASLTPDHQDWPQYAEGYRDALYELKWTPPTPEAIAAMQDFAAHERLGERLSHSRTNPDEE